MRGSNAMKTGFRRAIWGLAAILVTLGTLAVQETAYQPKFAGDPAHSDSEGAALGYMRTVLRAQRQYKQKYNHYATSLPELVHTGSFTRRMTKTERGDYTVGFRAKKDK